MKKDLKWFKEKIRKSSMLADFQANNIMELVDEIEQPELPEAPEWFDEWMNNGGFEKSLFGAFNELYEHHHFKMQVWANSLLMGHSELQQVIAGILKGGLNSYAVKGERYYVVNKSGESLLVRVTDAEHTNKVAYSHVRLLSHIFDHGEEELHQFTEKEIKDYEERYWPFAVSVEHIENKFKEGVI